MSYTQLDHGEVGRPFAFGIMARGQVMDEILGRCFRTTQMDNGNWTWTLTGYLGKFLTLAEEVAGSRDKCWTFLGIEFYGDTPRTWYQSGEKRLLIRLTDSAATNWGQAVYQLAHEAMHLISPGGEKHPALTFEEGLCTYFQDKIALDFEGFVCPAEPGYREAKADIGKLFSIDELAIKKIRAVQSNLWDVTPEDVRKGIPKVPADLAGRMCAPFRVPR
jgi:hypothetical protein